MKKIIVVSHCMEIGGAERSLIALLNSFDYSKFKVDLFLLRKEGELLKYIPKEVNILLENNKYKQLAVPIKKVIKEQHFDIAYGRFKSKIASKVHDIFNKPKNESYVELEYSHKYTKKFMPNISDEEYDLAISYLTPHYFVNDKVIAKKKIAWIHTDYSYIDIDVKSELKMWSIYDNIIAISKSVKESFLLKFPSLNEKIILIDNIINSKFIKQQAAELNSVKEFKKENINILSIGRFTKPKNFDNIPNICKNILKYRINVKWYLIGFGIDEEKIKERIKNEGVEDNVIILGKKVNPYPYIKACDLYVQPSRYEGKAVSVLEAQVLEKPVVITEFPTAKSQLRDKIDGIIVPLNNNECAKNLVKIIKNKELQDKLIQNCKNSNYENSYEINKIYSLLQ